jgi:hypothetical protein
MGVLHHFFVQACFGPEVMPGQARAMLTAACAAAKQEAVNRSMIIIGLLLPWHPRAEYLD